MAKRSRRMRFFIAGAICDAACLVLAGAWWTYINRAPTVSLPPVTYPNPNGYTRLLEAGQLLVREDDVNAAIAKPGTENRGKPLPVFTNAQKAALVQANHPALVAAGEALDLPFQATPSWKENARSYARFRQFARTLMLAGKVEEARGDYDQAATYYRTTMQEGVKVSNGTLLPRLVGIACESIGRRPLFRVADKLSADTARATARKLMIGEQERSTLARTVQAEKRDFLESILGDFRRQNVLKLARSAGVIDGDTSPDKPFSPGKQLRAYAGVLAHSKQNVLNAYGQYMDATAVWASLPRPADVPSPSVPSDPFNQLFAPDFRSIVHKDCDNRAQTALLVSKLALHAFYASHHAYPQTMNELVETGILERLPSDPFAKAAGDPLCYRKTAAGYLLYSVGPDGQDDGGKPINNRYSDGTYKAWTERDSQGDFVVNVNL